MSNRPKWSAAGFAQRVKMSEDDLWLIVEGRDHDRPHYEKLLKSLPSTKDRSVSIRLAETIDLNGVAAGGKVHVLALHDHLEAGDKLTTENKSGESTIVFMVDRDRDDFMGTLRTSDHVIYTFGTDVEADILLHSDIWAALRAAYGVDSKISDKVKRAVQDPPSELLSLWESWLRLGLTALRCDEPGYAPWGTLSRVNSNHFDRVKAEEVSQVSEKIQAAVYEATHAVACAEASKHLSAQGVRLLKGRWIARYIKHLVETHLSGEIIRVNVPPNAVIDTALAALTYDDQWAEEYDAQISKVLPGSGLASSRLPSHT
ncbi:hypothetical protein [Brachybacterium sp. FME24]|uniref:hypothetical protein n=1 Tax=Brachybacterium sp. FME24 TaxID=2742605 RepID=UPI001868C476|nr:hypothetical protein [Brachybacterium sp. FME24]